MHFLIAILGCFLLYRQSKYFPTTGRSGNLALRMSRRSLNVAGSLLLLLSAVLSSIEYGLGTGLLVSFATVTFGLCLLLIVLPLHRSLVYLLLAICSSLIILERILYYAS